MAKPDIDRILEMLLGDRRLSEGAAFTSRTYSDEPIIQTGRQMRERQEQRQAARDRAREMREDARGLKRRTDGSGRMRDHMANVPASDPGRTVIPGRAVPINGKPSNAGSSADAPDRGNAPHRPGSASRPGSQQLSLPMFEKPYEKARVERESIPQRYYELRDLSEIWGTPSMSSARGSLAYGTRSASLLFYEQARLMEDFEDEYDFHGTFEQYFPTYSSMTLSQLRGYFSWRTHVRAGQMDEAPVSFAFLHAYELLCGIGTEPGEQGLRDLVALRDGYLATDGGHGSSFAAYLRQWLREYVVYHDLDPSLLPEESSELGRGIAALLCAEEAILVQQGRARKLRALELGTVPSDDELLHALSNCSSYQICGARLYRDDADAVRTVACDTFRALVTHCSKRRKTDFVEGLFGEPRLTPYTMFASAIFYDPNRHPDAFVQLSPTESYKCADGRWYRQRLCDARERSSELGAIMHAVDKRLRDRLGYAYPLKERKVAAYVGKMIDKAIDALLARREEEERRRIDIDLSQLASIRAAAAVTQEALLTDEERGILEPATAIMQEPAPDAAETPVPEGSGFAEAALPQEAPSPVPANGSDAPTPESSLTSTPCAAGNNPQVVSQAGASPALSEPALRVLRALLAGEDATAALGPTDQMLSLVVDSINETFFDLVGDVVIEFDGDTPILIDDYAEDVRESVEAQ